MEKYISPFTDFGFKKLFGEEANKDILIDFLNQLLIGKAFIKDLTYLKTENLGNTPLDRRAVFDLYCENQNGEKFIVELQKVKQEFFKDRSIYYTTFPIQQQANKGDWDYSLKAIYTIGIMDFVFDDYQTRQFMHEVKLTEIQTCKVFYDKLTFIYLEMPKFNKTEAELQTNFDKWLYFLKNLVQLEARPLALREKIYEKAFEVAEIARYSPQEYAAYMDSIKAYRDFKNSVDTAYKEGSLEGEMKEKINIAKAMKKEGLSLDLIAKLTQLDLSTIEKID
jgi:predicted transposase/invertase (TIGR01784 family)